MGDEVTVVVEANDEPTEDVASDVTDATIDHEGRIARLEEMSQSFITRDDAAIMAGTIATVNDRVDDVMDEVQEVEQQVAEEQLEEEQEELEEELEPEQPVIVEEEAEEDKKPDSPPESKRAHRWWRTRGE